VDRALTAAGVSGPTPGLSADTWDEDVLRLGGHFLQSRAWQHVQRRLGHEVLADRGEGWMWGGPVRGGRFPRYVYVPYGPAGTSLDKALESIMRAARARNLDFARIEPDALDREALRAAGAVEARPVQPRWTWVLDLLPAIETLRGGLAAGHRGSINAAARRGLSLRRSSDAAEIALLWRLQRRAAAGGRHGGRGELYYRALAECLLPSGAASLYFAELHGEPVAAAISFDFGDTRYYAHAVSDPVAGRKLGAAAPLGWQMILDARAAGRHHFDFWGVAPPGTRDHEWAGFTRFKQAFGGRLIERSGSWEVPVRAARHRLFTLMRALRP
jgi:lipid II:glycine glycyltransferase (peptidoglycan interpeptide bridge formation enzyme)